MLQIPRLKAERIHSWQEEGVRGQLLGVLPEPLGRSNPTSLFPAETLYYTDDTAMARALVQSLLAKEAFDEVDMAHR